MTDQVITEVVGRVCKITFNRADKKNALTFAMYDAIADTLLSAAADPDVRAVLITGSGDSFCAGNDLLDFQKAPQMGDDSPVMRFLHALSTAPKPIVVAVNGVAVGVGLTMLLHSDIVFVSDTAKLSVPFVDLALVPEAASSLLLPASIGRALASDMLFTGRKLTGAEAVQYGLASRVLPEAELLEAAQEAATAIAQKAPKAVAITKELLRPHPDATASRMSEEAVHFLSQLQSPEVFEAISAFMQRRPPNFG